MMVAHVTKEGTIAGPKLVEHMVDTVVSFEQASAEVHTLQAVKNRFGSVDEIGFFRMTEKGLAEVEDAASLFEVLARCLQGALDMRARLGQVGVEGQPGGLEVEDDAGESLGERVVDFAGQALPLFQHARLPLDPCELAAGGFQLVDHAQALLGLAHDRADEEAEKDVEERDREESEQVLRQPLERQQRAAGLRHREAGPPGIGRLQPFLNEYRR